MSRYWATFRVTLGQEQIKIFFVNAFPPKPLDIATSNFAGA